ncbi:hypothetical protein LWI29_015730 [Acer saccharum]|uniref:Cyclic phosphodiesterase n=1 Tax=Acer saccharum TaxID=4024 RepID=A0AA39VG02_ACESA|nr:hypothetical protein LWI29_015730 [Acer saccharum]
MEVTESSAVATPAIQKNTYSVWAIPPEDVGARLKKIMEGLKSDFGGPHFEPHVTVIGAINLTAEDAAEKFKSACEGLKVYNCSVDRVATRHLLLHPNAEVVEASAHCCAHFGYSNSTPYMPHLSLLYADLTDDEKKKAEEKINALDDNIDKLSFPITRLALWKTDIGDKTLKSWEKVAECNLIPN